MDTKDIDKIKREYLIEYTEIPFDSHLNRFSFLNEKQMFKLLQNHKEDSLGDSYLKFKIYKVNEPLIDFS